MPPTNHDRSRRPPPRRRPRSRWPRARARWGPPAGATAMAGWALAPVAGLPRRHVRLRRPAEARQPGVLRRLEPDVDPVPAGLGRAREPHPRPGGASPARGGAARRGDLPGRAGGGCGDARRPVVARCGRGRDVAVVQPVPDGQLPREPVLHGVRHRLRLRLDTAARRRSRRRAVTGRHVHATWPGPAPASGPPPTVPVSFDVVQRRVRCHSTPAHVGPWAGRRASPLPAPISARRRARPSVPGARRHRPQDLLRCKGVFAAAAGRRGPRRRRARRGHSVGSAGSRARHRLTPVARARPTTSTSRPRPRRQRARVDIRVTAPTTTTTR